MTKPSCAHTLTLPALRGDPRDVPAAINPVTTAAGPGPQTSPPLDPQALQLIDAYWRAANYLSVGQIYLLGNPLLREPLEPAHLKRRLLGHWGTTPGLNFIYAHLNRAIRAHDLEAMYVIGPGHGGPGIVANAYLEGTYSEVYPEITRDENGLRRLFRQFSVSTRPACGLASFRGSRRSALRRLPLPRPAAMACSRPGRSPSCGSRRVKTSSSRARCGRCSTSAQGGCRNDDRRCPGLHP